MSPRPKPLSERFWNLVEKTDTCWLWRGHLDKYDARDRRRRLGVGPLPSP